MVFCRLQSTGDLKLFRQVITLKLDGWNSVNAKELNKYDIGGYQ